jgi:hypothetical protein
MIMYIHTYVCTYVAARFLCAILFTTYLLTIYSPVHILIGTYACYLMYRWCSYGMYEHGYSSTLHLYSGWLPRFTVLCTCGGVERRALLRTLYILMYVARVRDRIVTCAVTLFVIWGTRQSSHIHDEPIVSLATLYLLTRSFKCDIAYSIYSSIF